jgi:hypothetical protein
LTTASSRRTFAVKRQGVSAMSVIRTIVATYRGWNEQTRNADLRARVFPSMGQRWLANHRDYMQS